jgi:diacylglycerol kinase (ATP)
MVPALLIVNPAARGGRSAEGEALAAFAALGVPVELRRTTGPGDAARIATSEARGPHVFVLGGDGTVMEVVSALVGRDVAVGVLPGGTGNQLARHLGIPLRVRRAVAALAWAQHARIDLGRLADGRHFALTAGFGLDAAMILGASPALKRRIGVGAYFLSATRAVMRMRPFPVRIEADGKRFEREAGLAMVANVGAVMDGRFGLGPGVRPDDGWLDICIVSPKGLADGVTLAARMARRDFRDDPRMFFTRAQHVRLEAPEGVPAQADGEVLPLARLDAIVVPGGAQFLAPTHPTRIFQRTT